MRERKNPQRKRAAMIARQEWAHRTARSFTRRGQIVKLVDRAIAAARGPQQK